MLHIFTGKKGDVISKTLIEYFDSAPDPYLSTIRLLVNTSDFKHIKKNSSLAFTGLFTYNINEMTLLSYIYYVQVYRKIVLKLSTQFLYIVI